MISNEEVEQSNSNMELLPKRIIQTEMLSKLDRSRLVQFKEFMARKGIEHLFDKLLTNVRFISRKDVDSALSDISQKIGEFTQGKEFNLLIDNRKYSGGYLLKIIDLQKEPLKVIELQIPKWYEKNLPINKEGYYVYLDDAAYSGSQIAYNIKGFVQKAEVNPDKIMVGLVGSTNFALSQIQRISGVENVFPIFKIPTLQEVFTTEELDTLDNTFTSWRASPVQAVLTFFQHKVPDNFFGPLKKSIGTYMGKETNERLWLIDDTPGGFYPPYKEK